MLSILLQMNTFLQAFPSCVKMAIILREEKKTKILITKGTASTLEQEEGENILIISKYTAIKVL